MRTAQPRLPLAPLLRRTGLDRAVAIYKRGLPLRNCETAAPHTLLAEHLGVTIRTISRWSREGIPLSDADAAAAHFGFHPTEVWANFAEVTA